MNFLIKYFSPSFLIFSTFFLIYTFFKSEIILSGDYRNEYKTYYYISSILIFISITTFLINYKIKEYLVILVLSIVISLYLFEGYLTFIKQLSHKEQLYENQTGNKWDRRSKLEIYKDLKKSNNNVVVSVSAKTDNFNKFSIIPLSGISNSKTIDCNENGYYSIYHSDRYGFNNPNNEWDEQEIEYLLIGDSFTQGACVNRPNDIGSVLRNLSNKSVLNLGRNGSGPLNEYATIREYIDKNVKKVLWIYYEKNDFIELKKELKNNILLKYLDDLNFSQNLKAKQTEIDDLLTNLINREEEKGIEKEKNQREIFELINYIKISKTRKLFTNLSPTPPPPPLEFKKILKLTKKLVEKNNSKLYFIYLPTYNHYKTNSYNTNYNLVKHIVTGLRVPFIDIHKEVFEKEQNPLKLFPFELPGHYNVEGYKKVGKIIYKFTKD